MKNTTRARVLAASTIAWCFWTSGCSTSMSNNRALFKPTEKPGYVEGRCDEIKSLYWAQRNMVNEVHETRLNPKLAEVQVPAHYDFAGKLIESNRQLTDVVQ